MKTLLIFLVKVYQKTISRLFPGVCRYEPSCSQYTIEALQTHGVFKGLYLGTKRILRCHPWGGEGFDPVPPAKNKDKACHTRKDKLQRQKDVKDKKE